MRLYSIDDDRKTPGQWYLAPPVDDTGERLDPWFVLTARRPLPPEREFVVPIALPGRALDINVTGAGVMVVTERVGSLIGQLCPGDVQRVAARIDGLDDRYEIVNVRSWMDCIDRERTRAEAIVDGEVKHDSLAALTALTARHPGSIGPDLFSDWIKLSSEGHRGPADLLG